MKKAVYPIVCGAQLFFLYILNLGNTLTRKNLNEIIGEGEPLPWSTELALDYSMFIPIVFLIFLLAGKYINKQVKTETQLIILLTVEGILLAMISLVYALAFYKPMYDLGV